MQGERRGEECEIRIQIDLAAALQRAMIGSPLLMTTVSKPVDRKSSTPDGLRTTKGEKPADSGQLRERLIAALLHPLRGPILAILAERTASARDIAAETGASSESVGHQLRRLRRDGLVLLEESRKRRGVAENYYRATMDPIIEDEEFDSLLPEQRRRFSAHVIKRLYTDANRALKAGTFDSRSDMCSAHIRMLLDERGWRELAEIHRETFDKVIALRRRTEKRIDQSTSSVIPAAATILCFELPDLAVISRGG